jgi:hypothetical protein
VVLGEIEGVDVAIVGVGEGGATEGVSDGFCVGVGSGVGVAESVAVGVRIAVGAVITSGVSVARAVGGVGLSVTWAVVLHARAVSINHKNP